MAAEKNKSKKSEEERRGGGAHPASKKKLKRQHVNYRLCMYSQFIFNEMEHSGGALHHSLHTFMSAQHREKSKNRSLQAELKGGRKNDAVWKLISAIDAAGENS